MKRLALILFVVFSLSEARFFMGFHAGYLGSEEKVIAEEFFSRNRILVHENFLTKTSRGNGGIVGVSLGSEGFPYSDIIGYRVEINGGYGKTFYKNLATDKNESNSIFYAEFISDMLIHFVETPKKFAFGIFGGMGFGWYLNKPEVPILLGRKFKQSDELLSNQGHFFYMSARAGITMLVKNHHRFDLYASIPFVFEDVLSRDGSFVIEGDNGHSQRQIIDFKGNYTLKPSFIMGVFSYKYVF